MTGLRDQCSHTPDDGATYCVLPVGHGQDHRDNRGQTWPSKVAVVVRPPKSERRPS